MKRILTDAQLLAEIERCENCEEKPCTKACPAGCSPADFILAVKNGEKSDYQRSANMILSKNPLGGVCGEVCPITLCMKSCVYNDFNKPINIPAVQATIIHKTKELGVLPKFNKAVSNGKSIAIVGAGPAGLSAAAILAQKGYAVTIFEKESKSGGNCNAISDNWLSKKTLLTDIEFIENLGNIEIKYNQCVDKPESYLEGFSAVIMAIGATSELNQPRIDGIFYAGDMVAGRSTVVSAVASGKNAALKADAFLTYIHTLTTTSNTRCDVPLHGTINLPVSLEADFFGRKVKSPFLLSASPATDGYEQMKKAYEAGWAGGVMKNCFDNVSIHIPSEYMFLYNKNTYANCDNVSDHSLDRQCEEIRRLIQEFPDRLTIGATGGPVTGNDEHDKKGWQSNTLKLERAGAMAVEYSLSCPQGGDGTEGNIVSQNAKLTAKIVDWILEISNSEIPKMFKLTGAVTSIVPIVTAVKEVFAKYPNKKAGITLANSFPTLAFRKSNNKLWDEGVVAGMSGEGVKHISYLTLANVAKLGVYVSGNGGVMGYNDAANFLALGTKNVQVCSVVLKYGVNIVNELESGLSYLMQERGFKSVNDLIGCALPEPITDFMALTSIKKVSAVNPDLCQHCGNCTRCPYMAIRLNDGRIPEIDPTRCIGCSICVQKCFAGALYMRERTEAEIANNTTE